jgi:nucleotide-binding universal stress UspA family protein
MSVAGKSSFFDSVLSWVHQGYPHGVPQKDYFALLALLVRTLEEEEVVQAAATILKDADFDTPVTEDQIRDAIRQVIEKEPNPEEIHQVAARLASVGWPLAADRG